MNKYINIMLKQIHRVPIMRNSSQLARSNVSMMRYHLTCLNHGVGAAFVIFFQCKQVKI